MAFFSIKAFVAAPTPLSLISKHMLVCFVLFLPGPHSFSLLILGRSPIISAPLICIRRYCAAPPVPWPRRQTDVYNKLKATRSETGKRALRSAIKAFFPRRRNKLIPLTPAKHSFKRRLLFISRQFSRICRGNLVTASRGGKSCRGGGADMVNTSGKLIEGIGSACGRFFDKMP